MHPSVRSLSLAAAGLAGLASPTAPQTTPAGEGAARTAPFAHLALVERRAEVARRGGRWEKAVEGASLSIGDRLRVGADSVARLDLAWMSLALSSGAELRFPNEFVLSAALDSGRALVDSGTRDALPIVAGATAVRGRGRAVVRREGRTTLVTCIRGTFRVGAGRSTISLASGEGTVVADGRAPGRREQTPRPPVGIWPALDPVYVAQRTRIDLRWEGDAPTYQLELLPVGADVVLVQRDVERPPVGLEIPWPGAFRWRVSSRDRRGLEGLPSPEGLIAVE